MALLPASVSTSSSDETFQLGRELGRALAELPTGPARVIALVGDLGSGKTTFTKGLAAGCGVIDHARVTSPTFVLRQEYQGRVRIRHYDAYRLTGAAELLSLGFEEDLDSPGVVVMEWADRVKTVIPAEALWVEIAHPRAASKIPGPAAGDRRQLDLQGLPAWEAALSPVLLKFVRSGGR